ncbi:MAG: SRPBCC family protein [Planctomycetota bacterium]|jgi:hypothetical protein
MGTTEQSITIDAPPQRVWSTIRNFHDMSWAPNVITDCTSVGQRKGDQIGAQRVLNGGIQETLIEFSEVDRSYKYSIDDGPSPISKDDVEKYIGVVRVKGADGDHATEVQWTSSWRGMEQEVVDFCHPIYVALLEDLKKTLS